jgi:hypothetical protein
MVKVVNNKTGELVKGTRVALAFSSFALLHEPFLKQSIKTNLAKLALTILLPPLFV